MVCICVCQPLYPHEQQFHGYLVCLPPRFLARASSLGWPPVGLCAGYVSDVPLELCGGQGQIFPPQLTVTKE